MNFRDWLLTNGLIEKIGDEEKLTAEALVSLHDRYLKSQEPATEEDSDTEEMDDEYYYDDEEYYDEDDEEDDEDY